jgi:MFS family permease
MVDSKMITLRQILLNDGPPGFTFIIIAVMRLVKKRSVEEYQNTFNNLEVICGRARSLVLEQLPAYRGNMMSLYQASQNTAQLIGTTLAGVILITYDYPYLFILGLITLVGAMIFHFFTIDPTNSHLVTPELRGGEPKKYQEN